MRYYQFCKDENSIVTQIKHKINSEFSNEIMDLLHYSFAPLILFLVLYTLDLLP